MYKMLSLLGVLIALCFCGCSQHEEHKKVDSLKFGISAEYPPFEFYQDGQVVGFDIDLARLIGKEIGKEVVFEDMQYSTILPALGSHKIDAAISTITITEERKKNFDFSDPYYFEGMAALFLKGNSVFNKEDLADKKIAAQLGSTMEIWLKKNVPTATIIAIDNSNQAVESLKAGHVDLAFLDGAQAAMFSQKNPSLSYAMIAEADDGYGIVLPKGSPLKAQIDAAIKHLQQSGEIEKLKEKWLANGTAH